MTADSPLAQSRLDELWDFGDPALSEERFAGAERVAVSSDQRAELRTQRARALGLLERFDEAESLLDAIEPTSPTVRTRMLLERGRLRNSSGRPTDAVPFFEEAAEVAKSHDLTFLAVDALHMLAIADPRSAARHTNDALALVEATDDVRTQRWAVSLHNNLGWALHDEGHYVDALDEFEAAHRVSMEVGTDAQEYVARWAIARCLRSLGRNQEALLMQERLAVEDPDDGYVVEELAALRVAMDAG